MKLLEIGTILEIYRGKVPLNFSSEPKAGYFPYLDVEWMRTGRIRRYCDSLKGVVCDAGDILIVDRGSVGLVGKAIQGVIGSTLVRLSSEHLIRDFLYYFLLDKEHLLKSKGKSAMIPQIDWNFLKSLQIPLPPLNDQQKIVAPLVLLDAEGGASSVFRNSADFIKRQSSRKPLKAS
ncbi:type I restriction modification enzyme protein S [Candidatus Mycoplasma haematolamae str. Purdue]|uniref:Type I restriction modification enzyme protein S n=1 Tax=Mycoplasma haematolamae (strain Purdue) TaxID=1212765 RepID=I7CJN3_MYCHA|nr:restriction endonuclease subunit S [Candidatus Mycoplasma haematolamae]AFO52069.1 type I restriction modification enzyme protein S [Candidatus Mycoplasma haematolamae str. Purdue]